MRNLIVRAARRRRDDRGAVGVLVAILIGTGVLFGMGALVIDVGQLYQNQAELQNGADAAALAIAKSCVAGSCTPSVATSYADANASGLTGGTADVTFVCGMNGTVAVGTGNCGTGNKHCVANPPSGTNYVDVETSTELPNGSHLLPPVFARTLAGNGNYSGTTVYACSQAEWGPPLLGNTVGITVGLCDWSEATSNGATYPSPPPYPPNPSALPVVIDFHDPTGQESDSSCPSGPAGQTASGNFGWTFDPNSNCLLYPGNFTNTGGGIYTYGGNTGNNTPSDCQTILQSAQQKQTVLYIPIYSAYDGHGSNATYTLSGLGAFALTGYNFGNQFQVADRITGQVPCTGGGNGKGNGGSSVTCISGYFLHNQIPPPGSSLNGPDYGVQGYKLTG